VVQVHDGNCPEAARTRAADSNRNPDNNLCPTAGVNIDLFPSTSLYITATVIDPNAKHWDPVQKMFVTGPLESHLFYQIAGRHPDLNRNGVDDFIDIIQGKSKDTNRDGVPDEVQHCLKQLGELDGCKKKEADQRREWADAERQELGLSSCEQSCHGKPGEEACEVQCDERRQKAEGGEHELDERWHHQAHECREALRQFKRCEEEFNDSNHAIIQDNEQQDNSPKISAGGSA